MLKIVLLSLAVASAGLVLAPQASAACEPLLEPFCGEGSLPDQLTPDRCWTYQGEPWRIECEW